MHGDFNAETRHIDSSTRQLSIRSAISAFSDNIVFSLPGTGLKEIGAGLIVTYLANSVGKILTRAISLGCLVRGGIAFGPLHHERGVVFGPAMVEAYELESKF